jgi:oligosaccharide reducing-end xylanase
MKKISFLSAMLVLGVLLLACFSATLLSPDAASAGSGAYSTGTYRNLFAERGQSSTAIQAKLTAAWNQLFYGDSNTQRVYYPVGSNMAYIEDIGDGDVRSEGMSYGMMIAVQLNHQTEFNNLWNWAKTYMYHASGTQQGYFAWDCSPSGSILDNNPATDGEEWFAMSLLFAANRWGNGTGIYNYQTEALNILNNMLHHPSTNSETPMFNATNHLPVFVPYANAASFSDPSYHLPAYYQLWSYWDTANSGFWSSAVTASRAFFKTTVNSTTGLAPDYANFDGSPNATGSHDAFRFDAWRVVNNIAVDNAWFGADSWQTSEANTLLNFFSTQGLTTYANQYSLSGSALSSDHSTGLVAMNAVAALAANSSVAGSFVDQLWNATIPSGQWRYYDGMLYMLALLHASGNFKIYTPGNTGGTTTTPATTTTPIVTTPPTTTTTQPPTTTTTPPTTTTTTTPTVTTTTQPPTTTTVTSGQYSVQYSISSQWNTGYNISVTIVNKGNSPVNNWTISWQLAHGETFANFWNAQCSISGSTITCSNLSYNSTLGANGGSQNFGAQFNSSGGSTTPTSFTVNGIAVP